MGSLPISDALQATDPGLQYAALPYRLDDRGALEILLITSRESRRWVIPKGWPMKGKKPHAAAAKEALQEAGVVGEIGKTAIGCYGYIKRLKNGAPLACTVDVFPLRVTAQRKRWREKGQRVTHWFPAVDAAGNVEEEGLRDIIRGFVTELAAATKVPEPNP